MIIIAFFNPTFDSLTLFLLDSSHAIKTRVSISLMENSGNLAIQSLGFCLINMNAIADAMQTTLWYFTYAKQSLKFKVKSTLTLIECENANCGTKNFREFSSRKL